MAKSPEIEPELQRLLAEVNELAASVGAHPARGAGDDFLERVAALRARFAALLAGATLPEWQGRFGAYAEQRFALVDQAEEYARAAEEVLTLSLVLSEAPEAVAPALQRGLVLLSAVLAEPDVPRQFGRMLRRLRELARQSGSVELRAWVDGVVAALPG